MKKYKFPKSICEKITPANKTVVLRTEEEIEQFNKCVGYRKARVKRYGRVPKARKE